MSKITLVTGLWNIRRDALTEGWSRSYDHYLQKFSELLKSESNFIIFGDEELKDFVFSQPNRNDENILVGTVNCDDTCLGEIPILKENHIRFSYLQIIKVFNVLGR